MSETAPPAGRQDAEKAAAGRAAAALVESGMTVGLGSGSTAAAFVRALAERRLDIRAVATSLATAALAESLGIRVIELDDAGAIDLTVDGADEVGPGLALIKGAGAALLREKLVWEASARCVVVADSGKRVERLGAGAYPLPVEVVAFGCESTHRRIADALADLGPAPTSRWRMAGAETLKTDGGNVLLDLKFAAIADPPALAARLKRLTGVVEHGLFLGLAERALIAGPGGVETLLP
jgi:ribose 5-phosphate isomerase A